jgi:hypothetical protein
MAAQIELARGLKQGAEFINRLQAKLPDDRSETTFEQVVLVLFENDSGVGTDMLLKKSIVVGMNLPY